MRSLYAFELVVVLDELVGFEGGGGGGEEESEEEEREEEGFLELDHRHLGFCERER